MEESGSPRQVSRRISPSGLLEKTSLLYRFMTSPSMVLTIYTPNCATVRIHRMTKYLVSWTHPTTTRDVQSIFFACFFRTGTALCRFNDTPWIDRNHPVLIIIRFSSQLIFYKLLYTESIERNPLPTLTKLLHGLHGLSFWESDGGDMKKRKGKKGWGMNRLQIKFMVLKFCSSCYLHLLAAPDKTDWSIYAKLRQSSVSPVWGLNT